jgi:hypothetical protein
LSPNGQCVGAANAPAWIGTIYPFQGHPDKGFSVLFYAVSRNNPSAPPSSFYGKFFEDDPLYFNGYGTDPASLKVWLGDVPAPGFGPVVGTNDQWRNGLDYETFLAGGYTNPVPCIPLRFKALWKIRLKWLATITHGATFPALWSVHTSWTSAVSSTATYTSTWASSPRWISETTHGANYPSSWSIASSWSSVISTTADYASTWSIASSWSSVISTTADYASTWSIASSWSSTISEGDVFASTWSIASSWSSTISTTADYASTWSIASSWSSTISTTADYASTWSIASSWSSVISDGDVFTSTWSIASSWSSVISTTADYASTWSIASSWTSIVTTEDNVISFDCATIVAAGSTQGTATAIASDSVKVTTTGIGQGVLLPAGCYRVAVWNADSIGGHPVNVYPPSGAQINGHAVNNPASLSIQTASLFIQLPGGLWMQAALS